MIDQKLTINTFETQTVDNYPVELLSAAELDYATISLKFAGTFNNTLSKKLPTNQAFKVFNTAEFLTRSELRTTLNI